MGQAQSHPVAPGRTGRSLTLPPLPNRRGPALRGPLPRPKTRGPSESPATDRTLLRPGTGAFRGSVRMRPVAPVLGHLSEVPPHGSRGRSRHQQQPSRSFSHLRPSGIRVRGSPTQSHLVKPIFGWSGGAESPIANWKYGDRRPWRVGTCAVLYGDGFWCLDLGVSALAAVGPAQSHLVKPVWEAGFRWIANSRMVNWKFDI